MKPIGKRDRQRGVTLIELLAAMLITGFIVIMASRIFISGNRQFLLRSSESRSLERLYRVKNILQAALKGEVEKCVSGSLEIKDDSIAGGIGPNAGDAFSFLKSRIPELESAEFRCLETDKDGTSLVDWKDAFQPGLIEYRLVLDRKGKRDTLSGSWIK